MMGYRLGEGRRSGATVLIKCGLSARVTPVIEVEIKAKCPQVEFAEVANAKHHVTLDHPSRFVSAVRAFLAETLRVSVGT